MAAAPMLELAQVDAVLLETPVVVAIAAQVVNANPAMSVVPPVNESATAPVAQTASVTARETAAHRPVTSVEEPAVRPSILAALARAAIQTMFASITSVVQKHRVVGRSAAPRDNSAVRGNALRVVQMVWMFQLLLMGQ